MKTYNNICIVQMGRIGDLILSTPLIKTIKDAYPHAKLHVLAGRNNFFFLNNYPLVDKVHIHTKRPFKTIFLLRQLRKEKFDLWIDPKDHHSTESRYFVRLARPRESIGFNRKNENLYTHSIKSNKEQYNDHAIDRFLNTLVCLDLKPSLRQPVLFCSDPAEEKIRSFLKERSIPWYCHINISASRLVRLWEEDKWHSLIKLLEEKGITCLISAIKQDIPQAKRLEAAAGRSRFYPTNSLDDLFSLVNHAKIVVSPDTAVIHIASAFNRPTVGLYTNLGWNLNSFSPRADHSVMIINKKSETFIKDIDTIEVFNAVTGILALDLDTAFEKARFFTEI